MFFMVAEMPDGRIVINKTVTPDDDGVCKLMLDVYKRQASCCLKSGGRITG